MGDGIQINIPQPYAHNDSSGLGYVQNDVFGNKLFVLAYQIVNLGPFLEAYCVFLSKINVHSQKI